MNTETAPRLLDMEEMLSSGLTRRQLDYWSTKRYLRPDMSSPGSGNRRHWPAGERDIARVMVRLVRGGLAVEVAAAAARVYVEQGIDEIWIADGITIGLREVA